MDFALLKELCAISAPSGSEVHVKDFLLDYIAKNSVNWKSKPSIYHGEEFQDCVVLVFGNPRAAMFAHMDSVGFTVRYENQLIPIGGPDIRSGYKLVGHDSLGEIECTLSVDKHNRPFYEFGRAIERGTSLTFKPDFRETRNKIQCCSIDNRLGIFMALQVCSKIKDGIIVFSSWEEHGGGSVPYLIKFIYEKYQVRQCLISDITWITGGVHAGKGTVISLRDANVPRKSFIRKIIRIAQESGVLHQLEVEGSGSSDAREIQTSPYPVDWCFIGPPEDNVHSPDEIVAKKDVRETIKFYNTLFLKL